MRIRGLGGAAAAVALALAACGRDERAVEAPVEANAGANEAAVAGPAALPTDAAGFVAAVGASDLYEIRSSALAREKAASADLRSFAQRLEREHRQSSARLRTAATAAGVGAEPALDAEGRAMLDQLGDASGSAFDQAYLDQQRLAHQKTLMLLQNYAGAGDSEPLKAFASQARSMIEGHADALNYMR